MERWSGKVAIVTGASSGIGAAITRSLAEHNVKVAALARRLHKLQELADELPKYKIYPIQCDVTKEEEILRAFQWVEEKLGGADILVNNAGVSSTSTILDSPTTKYRLILDTNLVAPAICSREFCQSIKKRNSSGHILNINRLAYVSDPGTSTSPPLCGLGLIRLEWLDSRGIAGRYAEAIQMPFGMYGPSKYGLSALAAELRHEIILAKLNIRVTNISPGAVLTDMIKGIFEKCNDVVHNSAMLYSEDIAELVIYALEIPERAEEDCLRSSEEYVRITSNRTFCAGGMDGTGPCNGDSGGSFILYDTKTKRFYLRGVVSLSLIDQTSRSCDLKQLVVYVDAAKYLDWILATVLAETKDLSALSSK
ncbi:Dehydrogenase/reductase SDR family member 11 [Dufourea novaeangliae]|uniref:Dehydrogenase/reductase SDR family member 11 n=1 Tax=Dufourea novaeangliae TaxID=178035 RepID=A0A154PFJ4_DUFNO|nr:Dehydrogenase/reductase SDR family member 11 [Dufourea novaeangliae]